MPIYEHSVLECNKKLLTPQGSVLKKDNEINDANIDLLPEIDSIGHRLDVGLSINDGENTSDNPIFAVDINAAVAASVIHQHDARGHDRAVITSLDNHPQGSIHRLLNAHDNPIEVVSSPSPLELSPHLGDGYTTIIPSTTSGLDQDVTLPSLSLRLSPSSVSLPSPTNLLLVAGELEDYDDDPVPPRLPSVSADTFAIRASLMKCDPPLQSSSPWRKADFSIPSEPLPSDMPSGMPVSLTSMFSAGNNLPGSTASATAASTAVVVFQPSYRGNQGDGILSVKKGQTMSLNNELSQNHLPESESNQTEMIPWIQTSVVAKNVQSTAIDWNKFVPSSHDDSFDNNSSMAPLNNDSSVLLLSNEIMECETIGTSCMETTWSLDPGSGYSQPLSYPMPSMPLDDPMSLGEYGHYSSQKNDVLGYDILPPPSLPPLSKSFVPYFHSDGNNGLRCCSSNYPMVMDTYRPPRSGPSMTGPLSSSTSRVGPSHGPSLPPLSSYGNMASSTMISGPGPLSGSLSSYNNFHRPSSGPSLLPPFETNVPVYNGSRLALRDTLQHILCQQQQFSDITTVSRADVVMNDRSMTKHELHAVDPEPKFCNNCKITVTPSWRRCPQGRLLLCNACGL
ncbi:hypothetical protein FBU30_000652 [Linnemannia zychae]|nr:hypothetical protein FBU30_000652 [Linnemannia zychae]